MVSPLNLSIPSKGTNNWRTACLTPLFLLHADITFLSRGEDFDDTEAVFEEAAFDLLRQIDLDLASGSTVERAIRTAGISEATY